ncbi:Serine/threonine-protein kinase Nek11 [Lamellibrachia satsuma]|nr:Serine/threonine-protein kinase Nek11 [Lamellibrachia satsuma]
MHTIVLYCRGISHLNLSTRNIYLKNNCVKLTESRTLKNLYRHTAAGGHLTAATDDERDNNTTYRSPEELISGEFSTKSDIWSVGCIVYEMCTQEPLFSGRTREELNKNICEQSLPKFPDVFSTDLCHVWERLVDRDVASRPSAKDALNLPFVSAHLQDMEDSLHDSRCPGIDHSTQSLLLSPSQRVESNAFVRGVDSLTLDNTAGEDGDSRDTADEDADGSVDLALNEEETRQMFHMS